MKKNMLKAALYDPYLDVLGGGEKHILSILRVLADEGYEINIFWDQDLKKQLLQKFSFQYLKTARFLPKKLKTPLNLGAFDYFFYITDGSYFFSSAKHNFIFCMVPQKSLYQMGVLNRLKTRNYKFISNSKYTHNWLQKWGIKNDYIYPYIEDAFFAKSGDNKEKIILSVGRFFPQLHSKNQKKIIETFLMLKRKHAEFKDYRLILVGGVKKEDESYLNELKISAKKDSSIIFKVNINFNELCKLYKLSSIFWHFTGYGISESEHPEMVEHLGIAPLEAMGAGCITFCYAAGGPKEIITDEKNGFLFNSQDELIGKTSEILNDSKKESFIRNNARHYVKDNFSYKVFQKRVKEIIL